MCLPETSRVARSPQPSGPTLCRQDQGKTGEARGGAGRPKRGDQDKYFNARLTSQNKCATATLNKISHVNEVLQRVQCGVAGGPAARPVGARPRERKTGEAHATRPASVHGGAPSAAKRPRAPKGTEQGHTREEPRRHSAPRGEPGTKCPEQASGTGAPHSPPGLQTEARAGDKGHLDAAGAVRSGAFPGVTWRL